MFTRKISFIRYFLNYSHSICTFLIYVSKQIGDPINLYMHQFVIITLTENK